jgi:hypothetical protein
LLKLAVIVAGLNFAKTFGVMKKRVRMILLAMVLSLASIQNAGAQCSICTKTTQQLGEKPAKGMNSGILYLAFAPFAIVGYIGFRWWKRNKEE